MSQPSSESRSASRRRRVLLLVYGIIALAVGLGIGTCVYQKAEERKPQHRDPIPRAQFTEGIRGKTYQEMIESFGRPDTVDDVSFPEPTWIYRKRTIASDGTEDNSAVLYFKNGRVSILRYENKGVTTDAIKE